MFLDSGTCFVPTRAPLIFYPVMNISRKPLDINGNLASLYLPVLVATKQLRHSWDVIEIVSSFILIQLDLRFSTDTRHLNYNLQSTKVECECRDQLIYAKYVTFLLRKLV